MRSKAIASNAFCCSSRPIRRKNTSPANESRKPAPRPSAMSAVAAREHRGQADRDRHVERHRAGAQRRRRRSKVVRGAEQQHRDREGQVERVEKALELRRQRGAIGVAGDAEEHHVAEGEAGDAELQVERAAGGGHGVRRPLGVDRRLVAERGERPGDRAGRRRAADRRRCARSGGPGRLRCVRRPRRSARAAPAARRTMRSAAPAPRTSRRPRHRRPAPGAPRPPDRPAPRNDRRAADRASAGTRQQPDRRRSSRSARAPAAGRRRPRSRRSRRRRPRSPRRPRRSPPRNGGTAGRPRSGWRRRCWRRKGWRPSDVGRCRRRQPRQIGDQRRGGVLHAGLTDARQCLRESGSRAASLPDRRQSIAGGRVTQRSPCGTPRAALRLDRVAIACGGPNDRPREEY